MFLRRQNIQPNVIDNMHLFDVLLEIMTAVDPAIHGETNDETGRPSRTVSVNPKPGQSTYEALREAGFH